MSHIEYRTHAFTPAAGWHVWLTGTSPDHPPERLPMPGWVTVAEVEVTQDDYGDYHSEPTGELTVLPAWVYDGEVVTNKHPYVQADQGRAWPIAPGEDDPSPEQLAAWHREHCERAEAAARRRRDQLAARDASRAVAS